MKELAALAYRDTTSENREFWKNEMANALREISSTYDEKLDAMRGELETYYNLKVSTTPPPPSREAGQVMWSQFPRVIFYYIIHRNSTTKVRLSSLTDYQE